MKTILATTVSRICTSSGWTWRTAPSSGILRNSVLFDAYLHRHLWADNYFENLERLHLHFDKDLPVHGKIVSFDEEHAIVKAYQKAPEAFTDAAVKYCFNGGLCSGARVP